MSRRKDRAWQDVLAEHTTEGELDIVSLAQRFGVEPFQFSDGSWPSEEDLLEEAKATFYDPEGRQDDQPYVAVTLRCQRCDRRLDRFGLTANGWARDTPEAHETLGVHRHKLYASGEYRPQDAELILPLEPTGEWRLSQPSVTSAARNTLAGGGTLTYRCSCGRANIQFARDRIVRELVTGAPTEPIWSGYGDEAHPVKPPTLHITIAG